MLAFAIFAVTLVVTLIIGVIYLYPGSAKISTIPGLAATHPRDGNLAEITAAGSIYQFLTKLHKDKGPIVSFWFGPKFVVSIASPELFKEHEGVFDRPPEFFELFRPLIGDCSLQYANKADGRARRLLYDPSFGHQAIVNFAGTFNELANELVTKLSTVPKNDHLPLVQYCHAIVIKALTRTSFGDYFKDESKILKFQNAYSICWREMEVSLSDGLPEVGSDRQIKFQEALDFLHEVIRDVIKNQREKPPVGHQVFIDTLLENNLPERQILDDCITYMVGGFHTSGYLLAWALYFLATHQDCQERLCREVTEVVGQGDVDHSHWPDLKYARHVVDESLRVSVLAPYAARFQDTDTMLGGHVIPAGTPVFHALGVMLQDEEMWPEPEKFDPERFDAKNLSQRQKSAFKPFGFAGKRVCPGQRLASNELITFLAILCRAFKFRLVEGQVVESVHGLVTSPREEIWVTVEKRS